MSSALHKQPQYLPGSRVVIADIVYGRTARQRFNFRSQRAREIDDLTRHRHIKSLPCEAEARALAVAISSVAEPNRAAQWIRRWCIALDSDEQQDIISDAAKTCRKWTAPALGQLLQLTEGERKQLGIRTMRYVGQTPRKMRAAEMERDRERKRAARATERAGKPLSIEKQEPWKAAGVSRRTWYRRKGTEGTGQTKRARPKPHSSAAKPKTPPAALADTEARVTENVRNILPILHRTKTVPPPERGGDGDVGWPPASRLHFTEKRRGAQAQACRAEGQELTSLPGGAQP